jgi:hypothetical protein
MAEVTSSDWGVTWWIPSKWCVVTDVTIIIMSCQYVTSRHFMLRNFVQPIAVAARSKTWVYGRSLAGIAGSNPAEAWMSVVSVVWCQLEVSASGWSLVQRNLTECGVCVCVIRCTINHLHRQWVDRQGSDEAEEIFDIVNGITLCVDVVMFVCVSVCDAVSAPKVLERFFFKFYIKTCSQKKLSGNFTQFSTCRSLIPISGLCNKVRGTKRTYVALRAVFSVTDFSESRFK